MPLLSVTDLPGIGYAGSTPFLPTVSGTPLRLMLSLTRDCGTPTLLVLSVALVVAPGVNMYSTRGELGKETGSTSCVSTPIRTECHFSLLRVLSNVVSFRSERRECRCL